MANLFDEEEGDGDERTRNEESKVMAFFFDLKARPHRVLVREEVFRSWRPVFLLLIVMRSREKKKKR